MEFDYDLFVIGGGSGGVRAARLVAGEHGARVGLAEEYRMGGTCVIRGCVPKKLMVYASGYSTIVHDAGAFGWELQQGEFRWSTFQRHMAAELTRLEGLYRNTLDKAGVEVFDCRATLRDAHTVALGDDRTVTAKHILVAVGGHPVRPDIEGAELGLISADMFLLDDLPDSMLIVGGGYIACEFACIMNGLGVKTTQYYRGEQILRGFDDECRDHVADMIRLRGVDLRCHVNAEKLEKVDGGIKVTSTKGDETVFGQVVFATGRVPNTKGLGLEDAGVRLGKGGVIEVDDYSQTTVPSVYAVGDVTDRIQLTPVAIREGAAFVDTVFGGKPTKPDHDRVPSAIFTQPEMGTVGLTEAEARERGPVEIYSTTFRAMEHAFAGDDEKVLMKLVVDKASRQ
ncbi:MAG: FAD-dependent oxidoreductase, partial [Roseovarius sp.]